MVAQTYKVSRKKQDEYALISHTRAFEVPTHNMIYSISFQLFNNAPLCPTQASTKGIFAEEILPIEIRGSTISIDDTIRPSVSIDSLASLKPVFPDWGEASTTAGNASGVGDGAALCILTTRERAEKEGMEVLGKWVGSAIVGVEPRYMGISPVAAIPKVLGMYGLGKEDVDVYEVGFLEVFFWSGMYADAGLVVL